MGIKRLSRIVCIAIAVLFVMVSISFAQEKDESGRLKGKAIFEEKCSMCHKTSRALILLKSAEEWDATVKKMQTKTKMIKDSDVKEIVWYLSSKSLFDKKCSKCHGTDRPLGKKKSKSGWEMTVNRMKKKSPGWISDEEAKQIIDYIFTERGE